MRFRSSVTSLSWIPSEAVEGMTRVPFDLGVAHYDDPPPDVITDLDELQRTDQFRFANELRGWIEVEGGRIEAAGHEGRGLIGSTRVQVGPRAVVFNAVSFPDIRPEPEITGGSARFVQTTGGRTGVPAPRHVRRPPFLQLAAPLAWSTLALTIHADGSSEFDVVGASAFPRHWIYDGEGRLAAKTGVIDFQGWYRTAFGSHTPWGAEDSPTVVTLAETALERQLSVAIMRSGEEPTRRRLAPGETLVEQGDPGQWVFLLLDGVLLVEVDGEAVAEVGPGAILGERAILEHGVRTSTLRAVTSARVAVASAGQVSLEALAEISQRHRREAPPA
jgi:hypothetical protein